MPGRERNPDGTFKSSGAGKKRRPAGEAGAEPAYQHLPADMEFLRQAVTQQDWLAIFTTAKAQAIGDDVKDSAAQDRARRFLSDYFFGKPAQAKRESSSSRIDDGYDDMNNDEFWELARKQLAERDRMRAAEMSGADADTLSNPGPVQAALWPDLDEC